MKVHFGGFHWIFSGGEMEFIVSFASVGLGDGLNVDLVWNLLEEDGVSWYFNFPIDMSLTSHILSI